MREPRRTPYFPFYPHDWLSGRAVAIMTPAQRGAFIQLLAHAWVSDPPCVLTDDDAQLAALSGLGAAWATEGLYVKAQFGPVAGGLRNRKQWQVFCEWRQHSRRKAAAGQLGGRTKAFNQQTASRTVAEPKQTASSTPSKSYPSSSSSSSSSSSKEREKSVSLSSPSTDPFTDPIVTERAGRFVEKYAQELYPKHRNGARYLVRPARDYAAAVTLCQTWPDDARLEQLAVIFLKTDHKFAEEGSRTLPQFVALASWADARLAEHEGQAVR